MRGRAACRVLLASATALCSATCSDTPHAASPDAMTTWGPAAVDETVADMMPSGRTSPVRVPVRGGVTAIQVTAVDAPDAAGYCFQLEEVADGHGVEIVAAANNRLEWGRTCFACSQRVSVGHGFGWFVLPNDGREHDFGDYLDLVVSTRDCSTLLPVDPTFPAFGQDTPTAVRVRTFSFARRPQDVTLDLFAAYTADSGLDGRNARDWLARVTDLAAGYFPADAPALALRGSAAVGLVPGRVRFGDGEQAALDEIHRAASAAKATRGLADTPMGLVIFTRCLEHVGTDGISSETQGFVPRVPGGGGDGTFADGVFVSVSGCGAGAVLATPERAAKVLAHELGHFLGLYHTVEASGAEDLLPDTDSHNLMNYLPDTAGSSGLSARQVLVMRSHPYVRGPADIGPATNQNILAVDACN